MVCLHIAVFDSSVQILSDGACDIWFQGLEPVNCSF